MKQVLYLFGHLSDEDVAWMKEIGQLSTLKAGETLITEGSHPASLFIVLDGQLQVEVSTIGRVAVLEMGAMLGEMSFVEDAPASATVVALTRSNVLALPKKMVEQRAAANAEFSARFYKSLAILLANRLRRMAHPEQDELDDVVLDRITVAGLRFRQLISEFKQHL
jgi:CRP-like cAMP-binding protein